MPSTKFVILPDGLEAQFRLKTKNEEIEEGQIEDDDEDDDEEASDGDEEGEDSGAATGEGSAESKNKVNDQANGNGYQAVAGDMGVEGPKKNLKSRIPLFEMQSFLIALVLPEPRLSTPPTWCRVLRCMRASNVGIFLFDNVDLDWIEDKGEVFNHAFKFETSPNWIEQLTSIPLSRRMQNMTIPAEFRAGPGRFELNLNAKPKIPKASLLLSPLQQIIEGYPMPTEEHIKLLRSKYSPVDDESPLFAIDCEMCITDHSELTRISIVDEEMRVVYNELVKPEAPITNYLTRYSGITPDMMKDVTTTLDDVQYYMRKNLPRDAILCGHSLNMDLAAIQIFHPYVIDTSVIYNRTGTRSYKPSLKSLAYELLGKEIQTADKVGHDSLEDAVTALELVKLKLVNGTIFGDSVNFEKSQGLKYDSKTGITHLQIDKFIERHKVISISYRSVDTTPGARCLYVHDKQEPLEPEIKDSIDYLLKKDTAICVILTNSGECYVKF